MAENELRYWKQAHETKCKEYAELQNTYKEFQQSSHEFETELEEELAQAQIEAERHKARSSKVDTQLRKVREEAERQRRLHDDEVAALQEKLQALASGKPQTDNLEHTHKLMKDKGDLERQLSDLQDDLDSAQEKMELMQTEMDEIHDAHDEEVQALRSQLTQMKADLLKSGGGADPGAAESQYADLVENLREELKGMQVRHDQLLEDKDQLEARLLEESELNEELTGEVSDLTDDFMANSDKIEELELKLAEAQQAAEKAVNDYKRSRRDSAAAASEAAAQAAAGTVAIEQKELEELRAQLRTLEDTNEQLEEKNTELKNQVEVQEKYGTELQEEVARLTDASLDAEKKLRDVQATAEGTQSEHSQLKATVKSLTAELKDTQARADESERVLSEIKGKYDNVASDVADQARAGQENLQVIQRERDNVLLKLEEVEQELKDTKVQLEQVTAERDDYARAKKEQAAVRAKLREEQKSAQSSALAAAAGKNPALAGVSSNMTLLKGTLAGISSEVESHSDFITEGFGKLRTGFGQVLTTLKSVRKNYKEAMKEKKKIFDNLQDVKGNIRVFCRVRPLSSSEKKAGHTNCLEFPGDGQIAIVGGRGSADQAKTFSFDRVYNSLADQADIFKDVQNLTESVLEGYNVCIFAYGQTGSGKTYTMEGPASNRGVNFRAVHSLFRKTRALAPQYTYKISVSLLEIYNEVLGDLLDSDNVAAVGLEDKSSESGDKGERLQVRNGPHGNYVTNAKRLVVNNADEVMDVIKQGAKNRAVGRTDANEHSSRSHSILMVFVEGTDQVSQNKFFGKLQLVDLAGSERVAHSQSSGQRLVEATYINKSLSALGDVMTALSNASGKKSSAHIPYRNSKLTFLLQDSLGGNSKTMMFVNCSPVDRSAPETLCSLQFARRVRKVKLSAKASQQNATLNVYRDKVVDMKEEVKRVKDQLRKLRDKNDNKLKERDNLIFELNQQMKQKVTQLNHIELARKKELATLQAEQQKAQKALGMDKSKANEERLQKKLQTVSDKLDHVQQLLKLSQRENKSLKEKVTRAAEESKSKPSKKKSKEERRARMEALNKKRSAGGGEATEDVATLQKALGDKEQINKVLRNKNRKLFADVQQLRTALKKVEMERILKGGGRNRTRGSLVRSDSSDYGDTSSTTSSSKRGTPKNSIGRKGRR